MRCAMKAQLMHVYLDCARVFGEALQKWKRLFFAGQSLTPLIRKRTKHAANVTRHMPRCSIISVSTVVDGEWSAGARTLPRRKARPLPTAPRPRSPAYQRRDRSSGCRGTVRPRGFRAVRPNGSDSHPPALRRASRANRSVTNAATARHSTPLARAPPRTSLVLIDYAERWITSLAEAHSDQQYLLFWLAHQPRVSSALGAALLQRRAVPDGARAGRILNFLWANIPSLR